MFILSLQITDLIYKVITTHGSPLSIANCESLQKLCLPVPNFRPRHRYCPLPRLQGIPASGGSCSGIPYPQSEHKDSGRFQVCCGIRLREQHRLGRGHRLHLYSSIVYQCSSCHSRSCAAHWDHRHPRHCICAQGAIIVCVCVCTVIIYEFILILLLLL